jgi:hypothetical protein
VFSGRAALAASGGEDAALGGREGSPKLDVQLAREAQLEEESAQVS